MQEETERYRVSVTSRDEGPSSRSAQRVPNRRPQSLIGW